MRLTMDNIRVFLWVGLLFLLWMCVQAWQQTFPRATAPVDGGNAGTTLSSEATPAAPDLPTLTPTAPATSAAAPSAPSAEAPAPTVIRVRTDVLDVEIDLNGGDLRAVRLPTYPLHKDQPDVPVQLLNPDATHFYALQTGLRAADGQPEANHLAAFTAAGEEFTLTPGQDELVVPLTWQGPNGVVVEKNYRFRRGSFEVGLDYTVRNEGPAPYGAANYLQIQRAYLPPERSMFDVESYSFFGPVAYDGQKYVKLDIGDLESTPFTQSVSKGWIASLQHYFLTAAVPPPTEQWNYEGRFAQGRYIINAIGPLKEIPAGASATFNTSLFIGPKLQHQLETTAPGLELTADYGLLTILAQPLFWILEKIHGVVGNWGWAIIICTALIKLAFYKLSEMSGRSMARMRKLAPRMKALQDRYKDDRQAMSAALMDLYKKEKINPAAGCLPMLVQIPFFIAFYWVLLESAEMRQAPFVLWITDLSARDPYFILPLLMGAAMYLQQKLNPAPPDPVQAKMMQIMPVVFTGFFAFFPAGLVLYWITNSVLSIAQQWRINKVLGAD